MAEALHWLTLTELSSALRRGDVTSVELTRHLLERIERLDPGLHAFRRTQPEAALDAAREADELLAREEDRGPLHGLPFAVKDPPMWPASPRLPARDYSTTTWPRKILLWSVACVQPA